MATLTLNPVAGANSPCDGYAGASISQDTFANLRAAAGSYSWVTDATDYIQLLSGTVTSDWTQLGRFIFNFNSSSLGAGAVITAATFSLHGYSAHTDSFADSVGVTTVTPASTANVVNGDYATANYGSTHLATDITVASWKDSGWNDFALNSSGLAAINKTGVTSLAFRFKSDIDNAQPTWKAGAPENLDFYMADNGSNEPKLVITYTVPTTNSFFFNGVR